MLLPPNHPLLPPYHPLLPPYHPRLPPYRLLLPPYYPLLPPYRLLLPPYRSTPLSAGRGAVCGPRSGRLLRQRSDVRGAPLSAERKGLLRISGVLLAGPLPGRSRW
eukprot:1196125-Prorocentrum_minimum.AAC.3